MLIYDNISVLLPVYGLCSRVAVVAVKIVQCCNISVCLTVCIRIYVDFLRLSKFTWVLSFAIVKFINPYYGRHVNGLIWSRAGGALVSNGRYF